MFGNSYYVVNIIDIGNEKKVNGKRKCAVGTTGYIPYEWGVDGQDYDDAKFDVFSLAMMMLELEMFDLKFTQFKHMFVVYMKQFFLPNLDNNTDSYQKMTADFLDYLETNPDGFQKIEKTELFSTAHRVFPTYKSPLKQFTDSMKVFYPKFEEEVINIIQEKNKHVQNEEDKTEFTIKNYIREKPNKLRLFFFGIIHFVITHLFDSTLFLKFNFERSELFLPDLSWDEYKNGILVDKDKEGTLHSHQKYWIYKQQLEFKMREKRKDIMIFCLITLLYGVTQRQTLETFKTDMLKKYNDIDGIFNEEIEDLEILADNVSVQSLKKSKKMIKNWLNDKKKNDKSQKKLVSASNQTGLLDQSHLSVLTKKNISLGIEMVVRTNFEQNMKNLEYGAADLDFDEDNEVPQNNQQMGDVQDPNDVQEPKPNLDDDGNNLGQNVNKDVLSPKTGKIEDDVQGAKSNNLDDLLGPPNNEDKLEISDPSKDEKNKD